VGKKQGIKEEIHDYQFEYQVAMKLPEDTKEYYNVTKKYARSIGGGHYETTLSNAKKMIEDLITRTYRNELYRYKIIKIDGKTIPNAKWIELNWNEDEIADLFDRSEKHMGKKQAEADEIAAVELFNHIMNPGTPLHERFKFFVIMYNKKVKKGIFDETLAVKGFINLVNAGWSSYKKEYYEPGSKATLDMATKQVIAKLLLKEYNANWKGKPLPGQNKANKAGAVAKGKKADIGKLTQNQKDIIAKMKNGWVLAEGRDGFAIIPPNAAYDMAKGKYVEMPIIPRKTVVALLHKGLIKESVFEENAALNEKAQHYVLTKNEVGNNTNERYWIWWSSGPWQSFGELTKPAPEKLKTPLKNSLGRIQAIDELISIRKQNSGNDYVVVLYNARGEKIAIGFNDSKNYLENAQYLNPAKNKVYAGKKTNRTEESEYEGPVDDDIILMNDGDVVIYSQGSRYNNIGNFKNDFHEDEAETWEAIFVSMNQRQYWGNVWKEYERGNPDLVTDAPKLKFLKLTKIETPAQALKALKDSGADDASEENAKYHVGEFYLENDTEVNAPFSLRVEKDDKNAAKYGKQKVFFVVNGQDDKAQVEGWLYKGDFYLLPGKWQDIVEGLNDAKKGKVSARITKTGMGVAWPTGAVGIAWGKGKKKKAKK
jgi:hypothetical protein